MEQQEQEKVKDSLEEYRFRRHQQIKDFKACFGTPAGKAVLAILREEYYDRPFDPGETLQYQAGQHNVIFSILETVNKNE